MTARSLELDLQSAGLLRDNGRGGSGDAGGIQAQQQRVRNLLLGAPLHPEIQLTATGVSSVELYVTTMQIQALTNGRIGNPHQIPCPQAQARRFGLL